MDDQRHARSSSSPSVKIVELTHRKRGRPGEEIRVVLADASSFFISRRVWEQAPFHEDEELSVGRWEQILSTSRFHVAYNRALSLLSRQEHSRFLLHQKLRQRQLDEQSIVHALDSLEDAGYLDDARFAESWARSRLRSHPEGRAVLVERLRERGVRADLAEQTIDRLLHENEAAFIDSASRFVEKILRRTTPSREEIVDKLYRRGFSRAIIGEVMHRHSID
ncbi:MAG: regulatory protein RecX [Spirochaetales bacterium]